MGGNQATKGLSLVELLVVLAIVGVLVALSVGLLSADGPELRRAATDLITVFRTGRMEAIKRDLPVVVDLSGATSMGKIVAFVDTDGDQSLGPSERPLTTFTLSEYKSGLELVSASFGGEPLNTRLIWQPEGLPKDAQGGLATGTIQLKNRKNQVLQLNISKVGRITIP